MSTTNLFVETHCPLVAIPPVSHAAAGAVTSAYAKVSGYHRLALLIHFGAITATGTVTVQLLQAKTSTGGSAKGIPETATQEKTSTAIVTADANGIVAIEMDASELDVSGGFEYVAVKYDVDTDNVTFGAILFGVEPRFAPVAITGYNEIEYV
jgi:hypothetical protein